MSEREPKVTYGPDDPRWAAMRVNQGNKRAGTFKPLARDASYTETLIRQVMVARGWNFAQISDLLKQLRRAAK